jgi:hypothetical protein
VFPRFFVSLSYRWGSELSAVAALFDRDKRATVAGYSVINAAGRLNAKRRAAPGQLSLQLSPAASDDGMQV